MKLDLLAISAHPDDVELGCAGTILVALEQGRRVGILDLTRGELGTRGTPEIRLQEAETAAKVLGVSVRDNVGLLDGFFHKPNVKFEYPYVPGNEGSGEVIQNGGGMLGWSLVGKELLSVDQLKS